MCSKLCQVEVKVKRVRYPYKLFRYSLSTIRATPAIQKQLLVVLLCRDNEYGSEQQCYLRYLKLDVLHVDGAE
jgi:hypothetical protein